MQEYTLFQSISTSPIGLLYVISFGVNFAMSQDIVAPPPPDIPPLISDKYLSDKNGNHVQDTLELNESLQTIYQQPTNFPIEPNAMVEVNLTFSTPITQQQIDDFIGIGGDIIYIYKAVSYGWKGRIQKDMISILPDIMGPAMVLLEEPPKMVRDMNIAVQTGRVRPIWMQGFANNQFGFTGNENITIGIIDSGIDASHPDLAGRQAYWEDLSEDNFQNPIDIEQHGTHVAGIALGNGASQQTWPDNQFYYTETGSLQDIPENYFYPISFSNLGPTNHTLTSRAIWTGGGLTRLCHISYQTNS